MTDRVRLALVGCGGISARHLEGYQDLHERGCREFEVAACCDLNEELARSQAAKIAVFQGKEPRVFRKIEDLIASGAADAADVCVPHCFHHSTAISLLEGGLHVQLEKPLGITIRASRKIIAAARRAGRLLATAENVRRTLEARACTWAIREAKLIGEVIAGETTLIKLKKLDVDEPRKQWRVVKLLTGGGMIIDNGVHFADMMLLLFGDVNEVWCTMRTLDECEFENAPILGRARVDVENYFHAVIRFANGVQVNWTGANRFHTEEINRGWLCGTQGTIFTREPAMHPFQHGGTITLADGRTLSSEKIQADYLTTLSAEERDRLFPYGATNGFSCEIHDFIRAVRTGANLEMDGEAGLRAKTLCECCYESATAGRPVKYADVLAGRVDAYQRPIDEYWKLLDEKPAAGRPKGHAPEPEGVASPTGRGSKKSVVA